MQRYSSKGSSSFREKEERASRLAAGLVLPHVVVKQGSSIIDREAMAAQSLAQAHVTCFAFYTIIYMKSDFLICFS